MALQKDSPFHVMWVLALEIQITTCMSRFPVHLRGHFRTLLLDQVSQEQKRINNFHFHSEFDVRSNAVEVMK